MPPTQFPPMLSLATPHAHVNSFRRGIQEGCKVAISGNIVRTVILSAAKNLVGAEGLASGPGDSSLRSE